MTRISFPLLLILGLFPASAPAGEDDAFRSVEYRLEEAGQVSAAVYDSDGVLVRELLRGDRQKPGEHTVRWDGLDRSGRPLPPGDYEWRLLRKPRLRAEYVTSLGINPDSAPYHRWVGNHGGAASVAVDESGMYVAAQVTETAPVLLKQSLDGTERLWTRSRGAVTDGRYQGGAALASDGRGTLYMLQQNGYLQPIDAETGAVEVNKHNRQGKWDALPDSVAKTLDERKEVRQRYRHGPDGLAGADIAAEGSTLVASFLEQDSVRWLSPDDGAVTEKVHVPEPYGVAVGSDGQVFVISKGRVLAVDPEEGVKRTVADEALTAPRRIALDAENEHLLVAERGRDQRVKRISLDGKLHASYGRKGGREQGPYEPEDFRGVTDIAADGTGGFLVAEPDTAPRRVARFDREGELVNEWYGGQPYYAWGEPDPRDPSKVWFNPGSWLTLAEVDYETGAWRVLANYHVDGMADGLVRSMPGHRGRWRVVYRGDRRYLVSERAPQVLAHEDGNLRPVAVVGKVDKVDRVAEIREPPADAKTFRWVDRSGDGAPQAEELTFSGSGDLPTGSHVTRDFAVLGGDNVRRDGELRFVVRRTEPRWTEDGPIYPIGDEEGVGRVVATTPCATRFGHRGRGVYQDEGGSYYGHYNAGPERHGAGWPTYWGGRSRFVKWDGDGRQRWKVGRHAVHGGLGDAPHTTPAGYMHVPVGVDGTAHGTVVLADRVETMGMAWTRDGLYAGSFFDARVDDGLPAHVYHWWRAPSGKEAITTSDYAAGGKVLEREDGTVLWYVQGRNSVPIYKVHGWEGWARKRGSITLEETAPHAAGDGSGLTAAYYGNTALDGRPAAERVDERVWHGVPRGEEGNHQVIDGFRRGPTYDWSDGVDPIGRSTDFAVRWSGRVEAPLSEPFTFSVYARGGVRLWIDGKQRIFGWNEATHRWETPPIDLKAGERYSVQLDFFATGDHPACSLNWESPSMDRQRIPTKHLYPKRSTPVAKEPDPRTVGRWVDARSFDDASDGVVADHVRGDEVRGLRQRGLGKTGAYLVYRRVDLTGASELEARCWGEPAGDGEFAVTLAFRTGGPDGPTVATVEMSDRENRRHTVDLTEQVSGVKDLYIVNTTPKRWHFVRLDRFRLR